MVEESAAGVSFAVHTTKEELGLGDDTGMTGFEELEAELDPLINVVPEEKKLKTTTKEESWR